MTGRRTLKMTHEISKDTSISYESERDEVSIVAAPQKKDGNVVIPARQLQSFMAEVDKMRSQFGYHNDGDRKTV